MEWRSPSFALATAPVPVGRGECSCFSVLSELASRRACPDVGLVGGHLVGTELEFESAQRADPAEFLEYNQISR